MIKDLWNWLKNNGKIIATIGGVLLILHYLGIDLNIVKFYESLEVEDKIIFMTVLNFVALLFSYSLLSDRIEKKDVAKKK